MTLGVLSTRAFMVYSDTWIYLHTRFNSLRYINVNRSGIKIGDVSVDVVTTDLPWLLDLHNSIMKCPFCMKRLFRIHVYAVHEYRPFEG